MTGLVFCTDSHPFIASLILIDQLSHTPLHHIIAGGRFNGFFVAPSACFGKLPFKLAWEGHHNGTGAVWLVDVRHLLLVCMCLVCTLTFVGQSINNGICDQNEKKEDQSLCVCVCGGRPEKVKRNLYKNYDANSSCTSECDSWYHHTLIAYTCFLIMHCLCVECIDLKECPACWSFLAKSVFIKSLKCEICDFCYNLEYIVGAFRYYYCYYCL